MVDAALAIAQDDQQSRDGFRLFRSSWDDIQKHKDGLTLDAQGLSALTTAVAKLLPASDRKSGNKFWVDQTRRTHTETAAPYGIIAVPDADDNAHRLTGRRRDFAAVLDVQHWRVGLLVLCGAFYIFLGATALGLAGVLGILGGASIWAVARIAPHSPRVAYVLLFSGALPFAAATWWSVITPVIAVLAVVIGVGVIHHADPSARTGQPH